MANGSYPLNRRISDIPVGCGSCPEYVLGILADDVQDTLTRVRRIKRLVTIANRLGAGAIGELIALLEELLNRIPNPPLIDLRELVALLTCPLTPQALAVDHVNRALAVAQEDVNRAGLNDIGAARTEQLAVSFWREMTNVAYLVQKPEQMLKKIRRILERFVAQLRDLFDGVLEQTQSIASRLWYRLYNEIKDAIKDADVFVVHLAITTASVGGVRATCPALYDRDDMPYKAFTHEMTSFSFDGVIPSGFSSVVEQLMRLFALIQAKITAWSTQALILV